MAPNTSESERIAFLLRRDGYEATRAWVERTLNIYREAVQGGDRHAADARYRALFERSIEEFARWLAAGRENDATRGDAAQNERV